MPSFLALLLPLPIEPTRLASDGSAPVFPIRSSSQPIFSAATPPHAAFFRFPVLSAPIDGVLLPIPI